MVRSINASIRAAEREAARESRLLEKERKLREKRDAAASAWERVRAWEEAKNQALSMHRDCGARIDWPTLLDRPLPREPVREDWRERQAENALASYKPTFFERLTGADAKKREQLELKADEAAEAEESAHEKALRDHKQLVDRIEVERDLAVGVLEADPSAYTEALEYHTERFDAISALATELSFSFRAGQLHARVRVAPELAALKTTWTLLKTGRESGKETPKTRYFEWYQESVASCALKVAAEALAIVPVPTVEVVVTTDLLDTSTGLLRESAILVVMVPRETLQKIHLQQADASDALQNFVHRMDFKKTTGFRPLPSTSEETPAR